MEAEQCKVEACLVLVTCGSTEEAERLAKEIVEERLAACVNVVGAGNPIRSFYVWENTLQQESEVLLLIKTFVEKLQAIEMKIKISHSYTVPEFMVLPVIYGAQNYIQWMKDSIN